MSKERKFARPKWRSLRDKNGMNLETSYCLTCFLEDHAYIRRIMRIVRHARNLRLAAAHVRRLVLLGDAPQIIYTFFFKRPPRSSFNDVDWLALVRYLAERGSGWMDIDEIR